MYWLLILGLHRNHIPPPPQRNARSTNVWVNVNVSVSKATNKKKIEERKEFLSPLQWNRCRIDTCCCLLSNCFSIFFSCQLVSILYTLQPKEKTCSLSLYVVVVVSMLVGFVVLLLILRLLSVQVCMKMVLRIARITISSSS